MTDGQQYPISPLPGHCGGPNPLSHLDLAQAFLLAKTTTTRDKWIVVSISGRLYSRQHRLLWYETTRTRSLINSN